jgi:hypothetical protein
MRGPRTRTTVTVLAAAVLAALLVLAVLYRSPRPHPADEGILQLADRWRLLSSGGEESLEGRVMTFSGLFPCVDGEGAVTIEAVEPVEIVGTGLVVATALLDDVVREEEPDTFFRSFINAAGWPPTDDGALLPGQLVPLPARGVPITDRCGAPPLGPGEAYQDVVVAISASDPDIGGGIDGLIVTYRHEEGQHRVRADVLWLLCGNDPARDVCRPYD